MSIPPRGQKVALEGVEPSPFHLKRPIWETRFPVESSRPRPAASATLAPHPTPSDPEVAGDGRLFRRAGSTFSGALSVCATGRYFSRYASWSRRATETQL